jgi:hypothetical protein
VTSDILLLTVAGIVAILAGGMVVLVAPGRFVSLIVGCALALLGVLQLGYARATLGAAWGDEALWYRYALALSLPATGLWVLGAAALGRSRFEGLASWWRLYLVLQGAASVAVVAWLLAPSGAAAPHARGILALDVPSRLALFLSLSNLVAYSVRFEVVYVSLSRRNRRAFRPAIAGILIGAVFTAMANASGLLTGQIELSDLAFGAGPVLLVALLVPISFVRGRVGEARIPTSHHPVAATTSFLLGAAFVGGTAVLFWMTHVLGVPLNRGLWLMAVGGLILGAGAVVVSNRARRRVERAFEPLWHDWRREERRAAARAASRLDACLTFEELVRELPANASALAVVEPIALFVADAKGSPYRCVGATRPMPPELIVLSNDPLASELRVARRPIRLHGRVDDLEYVSIYVENRSAIIACDARFAVPLCGEEGMMGFMLCGPRADGRKGLRRSARLLHFAARRYAGSLERTRRAPRTRIPQSRQIV